MRSSGTTLLSLLSAAALLLSSACTADTTAGVAAASSGGSTPGTSAAAAALALVPASAGGVTVTDLAEAKARWGLSGVTSADGDNSAGAIEFRKKLSGTDLPATLMGDIPSASPAGWSGLDVDVELQLAGDGPPVGIYQLRATLDMQKVIESFTADKMTRSGSADAPYFRPATLGIGTFGQAFLAGVTVFPAQHLLVSGPEGSWTPPTADSSLASAAGVQALIDGLPATDTFTLRTGAPTCIDPGADVSRLPPAAAKQYLAQLDAFGTRQKLTGTLVAVTGDTTGEIRAQYADGATAAADLPVREKLLHAMSLVTRTSYDTLFTATVTASGPMLKYAVTERRPAALIRAVQQNDTPWAFC